MVFSTYRRYLPLGSAEFHHVCTTKGCINRHKDTVRTFGLASFRDLNAFTRLQENFGILFWIGDIPATVKNREHSLLVGNIHLLGADRHGHITGSGAQQLHCQMETGRTGCATIFQIKYRNPLNTVLTQQNLTRNKRLSLQMTLSGTSIKSRLDIRLFAASIL